MNAYERIIALEQKTEMTDLRRRIARLESAGDNRHNDLLHDLVCLFAEQEGRPMPPKQDDIVLTLQQLGEVLRYELRKVHQRA